MNLNEPEFVFGHTTMHFPHFVLRIFGGGKKRKKKNYTKPKKKKHVHKKVKLRYLNYYKVEDSGLITRLRRQCPQCGPGTIMAAHHDRVYCGRCGITYEPEMKAHDSTPISNKI